MGQIWDAFTKSYSTEGLTGAKTVTGGKAYTFQTGYDIGSEIKISGFDIGYVARRAGLDNQQTLAVLANLKFQRYFISNGSLDLYNTYDTVNARSRLLGKRIKQWREREGLKATDIPARASYQAANPSTGDRSEVLAHGGSEKWIKEQGGEAKNLDLPNIPELSSFNLPSLPNFGFGGLKRSLQTTAIVVMLFIAAIIYLIFVKGRGMEGVEVSAVGK